MANVKKILIVGGGIAGLTLAIALYRKGFRPELVEASPTWRVEGGGILVQANGMRVLRALGLAPAVADAGIMIRRWGFYDQKGHTLCENDLQALWGEVGPCVGIARSRLQQVLLSGAASIPHRLGISAASLVQDGERVAVAFSDGSAADYSLVVGADGISSTVRALVISKNPSVYSGQMAWRSIAPVAPQSPATLRFVLGECCFFGLCPISAEGTYGFGNVAEARLRDTTAGRLERLRTRFAGFSDDVREYLASLNADEQVHCAPIEWVDVERWHVGRVLLIGDAAHASSPMMGQGGCMAMEDAFVLAEVLRASPTVENAIDTYLRRRRPRVSWVQGESRQVAESFCLPPFVRNSVLRERGSEMFQARFRPLLVSP